MIQTLKCYCLLNCNNQKIINDNVIGNKTAHFHKPDFPILLLKPCNCMLNISEHISELKIWQYTLFSTQERGQSHYCERHICWNNIKYQWNHSNSIWEPTKRQQRKQKSTNEVLLLYMKYWESDREFCRNIRKLWAAREQRQKQELPPQGKGLHHRGDNPWNPRGEVRQSE